VIEQFSRLPRVLARDQAGFFQNAKRAMCDVLEIAYGRGHHVQNALFLTVSHREGLSLGSSQINRSSQPRQLILIESMPSQRLDFAADLSAGLLQCTNPLGKILRMSRQPLQIREKSVHVQLQIFIGMGRIRARKC
jgi:hypothetical protein